MVEYLFNSSGHWIAFRKGKYVYDVRGKWVGWLPWDDSDVVSVNGSYLGSIVRYDNNHRLYKFLNWRYRGYPGYPGYRGYPGYPGYPGYGGYSPKPPMAEDVDLEKS